MISSAALSCGVGRSLVALQIQVNALNQVIVYPGELTWGVHVYGVVPLCC